VRGSDADEQRRIRICILGPLVVLRDGVAVPVGGAQQRAVLAFLLVQRNRAVSVEHIADALWADHPPAGHAATIQTYVYHLREILEPDRIKGESPRILVTEPGGYRLDIDPGTIDEIEFERLIESGERSLAQGSPADSAADLDRALSLWRGTVLADLTGFDFVARHGGRLDELRWRAIESKIDAELALGHHASVLAELNSLAESQPLREHLQAQRILALYRAGRQADALSAFRSVRARLRDELGIEPSAELTDLHQSMLNQDADLLLERPTPYERVAVTAPNEPAVRRTRRLSWRVVATAVISVVALAVATAFIVHYVRSSGPSSSPANSVVRIDADGSFHDPVAVGASPDEVEVAGKVAWVANTGAGSVSKIDLERHVVVQTTPVGVAPQALAVFGSDLWVVNSGAASVSRLSLKTDRVVDTVTVGNLPGAVAADASGVWVVNTGDDTVMRIDPITGRADKPIPVGFHPDGVAVDANTVWVSNRGDGTVSPIDTKSRIVGSSIAVGAGPADIAVFHGAVWVANSGSQTASRIDAASRRVVATVPAGDGPKSITLVGNRLWVANELDGSITVIDPAAGHAVKRIATGASVRGLATDGRSAYATTRSLVAVGHRGGTFHVTTGLLPDADGIDPSFAEDAFVFSAYSLVYDGLVAVQRTSGGAGLTLVPDLALELPRPSADGLAYTFRVRRGIHYSDGRVVKPADFRVGLQQQLTVAGDDHRLTNIVGAPACVRQKNVCDLTQGVVINDDAYEVTFKLREPDPDFLYKLSEPLFATPDGQAGKPATSPRPGTGPYMIGEYNETRFTLVRNPHFRPWSLAAQPEGYPDEIDWTAEADATKAVHNVLAGTTDADDRAPAATDYATLRRTNNDQFRFSFIARTGYLFLNTHIAPFDKSDVRKAINLAVDRNRIVALAGGATAAAPSCQIVPPNFPGYRRYCPYTANPTPDGKYHGPDFARALALVDRSHTRGTVVTVVSPSVWADPLAVATAREIARVLTTLGYKARHEPSRDENYFSSRNPAQIGIAVFYMDYPAPANAFGSLRCDSGPGGYCNPAADRLFTRAVDTERTDRIAAYADWKRLDRMLTDDAAYLNLYSAKSTMVLSARVGNYQVNPKIGPLYGQMWIVN
jgi:YVTN family beta-propeller protein